MSDTIDLSKFDFLHVAHLTIRFEKDMTISAYNERDVFMGTLGRLSQSHFAMRLQNFNYPNSTLMIDTCRSVSIILDNIRCGCIKTQGHITMLRLTNTNIDGFMQKGSIRDLLMDQTYIRILHLTNIREQVELLKVGIDKLCFRHIQALTITSCEIAHLKGCYIHYVRLNTHNTINNISTFINTSTFYNLATLTVKTSYLGFEDGVNVTLGNCTNQSFFDIGTDVVSYLVSTSI